MLENYATTWIGIFLGDTNHFFKFLLKKYTFGPLKYIYIYISEKLMVLLGAPTLVALIS